MKPHPIAQMKHPRQRIRLLPACSQPRLQVVVLILLHQRIEDQGPHALRLRIRPTRRSRLFGLLSISIVTDCRFLRAGAGSPSSSTTRKQQRSPHTEEKLHGYVSFPSTTGRCAPVAVGTLPGIRCHVSHPSNANATASFACAGTPNSSIERSPSLRVVQAPLEASPSASAFFTPPPATITSSSRAARSVQDAATQTSIRIEDRLRRKCRRRRNDVMRQPLQHRGTIARNLVANASPNCSRPQDFGGTQQNTSPSAPHRRSAATPSHAEPVAPLRSNAFP
jgi:hypothetical protein